MGIALTASQLDYKLTCIVTFLLYIEGNENAEDP
jgi:hypothetical protein